MDQFCNFSFKLLFYHFFSSNCFLQLNLNSIISNKKIVERSTGPSWAPIQGVSKAQPIAIPRGSWGTNHPDLSTQLWTSLSPSRSNFIKNQNFPPLQSPEVSSLHTQRLNKWERKRRKEAKQWWKLRNEGSLEIENHSPTLPISPPPLPISHQSSQNRFPEPTLARISMMPMISETLAPLLRRRGRSKLRPLTVISSSQLLLCFGFCSALS